MKQLWVWALSYLQGFCHHDPSTVVADILEGDYEGRAIQWCRVCGGYRFIAKGPGTTVGLLATATADVGAVRSRPMKSCGCRIMKSCSLHEAAPDMLGALKVLVRDRESQRLSGWPHFTRWPTEEAQKSSDAAWKRVEDAIRKAEGF